MFFASFRNNFKRAIAHANGKVKIAKRKVKISAIRYPIHKTIRLIPLKYSPPPSRQNAAPYRRICPSQACPDQRKSISVAVSQNRRSKIPSNIRPGRRQRKIRIRSYSIPSTIPNSTACPKATAC